MLVNKQRDLRRELIEKVRKDFFDSDCRVAETGVYTIYFNRKTTADDCSHYQDDYGSAYGTGTFFYRGGGPEASLRLLLHDHATGCFDDSKLFGHYFIFLIMPSGIRLLNDGTSLVKAFHDREGSYLASSFLLAAGLQGKLTLNRPAAIENLVTGAIVGTETLVNEITVFSADSHRLFPDIGFVAPGATGPRQQPLTRSGAIEEQSGALDNYFSSCAELAGTAGVDIGLTGGYDSRLILAHARNHFSNLQVHSHYRHTDSEELKIARQIAEGENIPFVSPEVVSPVEMDDKTLLGVIDSSCRFCDGAIRQHSNWMEEYNTLEYRMRVLGDKRLGFSGVGGEQYRNHDRLCCKPWLFRSWLKYSYVRKVAGKAFLRRKDEKELLDRIRTKMYTILGFPGRKAWIGIGDLKRIQNEIIIHAYRGARTDGENRHSWFLTPFADFHLSTAAYQVVRFLKDSKGFEAAMIRRADPGLASYATDYGYNLTGGEPLARKLVSSAYENLLPAFLKWKIRERFKSGRSGIDLRVKTGTSQLLKDYVSRVTALDLPLDVSLLMERTGTAHLVISLGYLLGKLEISAER